MNLGHLLSIVFEKMPEWSIKNDIRYFLAFNKLIPKSISDISPVKGYELYRKLKAGDIVVDAGAYPGDYAVFASRKVGKTGKVICFEPDSENRKVLRKNLEKERMNNFIIVPKGVWNKEEILKIKDFEGLHTEITNKGKKEVEVTSIDKELENLGIDKVDVIKMDIEGAEVKAVEGCRRILGENKVFFIIASYHIVDGKRTSYFLEDFFKKHGYKIKTGFPKHLTTYAWKE